MYMYMCMYIRVDVDDYLELVTNKLYNTIYNMVTNTL